MNLNQVTIPPTDVSRSTESYEELGSKRIVENLPTYARYYNKDGDASRSQGIDESAAAT